MKNLGFGMMRLPVLSGPTDFDYDQLNQMVDAFLAAGYTYFDTSFVYHDGKSEKRGSNPQSACGAVSER